MSDETARNLSRQQFDWVIRRAAELATTDLDAKEGRISEVELFRIASEVGLRETDVRRALMEVRSRGGGGTTLDRIFGFETVTASRLVSDAKVNLKNRLDDFLVASQLLRPVRRTSDLLVYQPAVDWVSRLARAASFTSQEHYIASAKSVEVRLEKLDYERVLVELLVDQGNRSSWIAQAALGGGVVGAAAGALVTVLGGIVTGGLITLASVAGLAARGEGSFTLRGASPNPNAERCLRLSSRVLWRTTWRRQNHQFWITRAARALTRNSGRSTDTYVRRIAWRRQ